MEKTIDVFDWRLEIGNGVDLVHGIGVVVVAVGGDDGDVEVRVGDEVR